MYKVTRRVFMKVAGVSAAALAMSDRLLVSRAAAQTGAWDKEEAGYTYCDACNGVPFCGIKFYRTGDIVTRMSPGPGSPRKPSVQRLMALCSVSIIPAGSSTP